MIQLVNKVQFCMRRTLAVELKCVMPAEHTSNACWELHSSRFYSKYHNILINFLKLHLSSIMDINSLNSLLHFRPLNICKMLFAAHLCGSFINHFFHSIPHLVTFQERSHPAGCIDVVFCCFFTNQEPTPWRRYE